MQFSIHSGLSIFGVVAVYLPALLSAEAFRGRADSPQTIGRSVNLLKSIDKRLNASSSNNTTIDLSWRDTISFSATHQSPAVAPPVVMPIFADSSADMSFNINSRNIGFGSVQRRDGALHCDNGDCVDGSCCSKDGICGYGPDFCGNGCRSLCNATAMCGEFSKDADVPCGMNLCCSATGWCGTTEVYCKNADPIHNTLPCQPGYGGCKIYGAPKCASSVNSAEGRKVGYYQSWNVRDRKCNSKTPKQLNTEGYTHLFYSFAFIDPTTFQLTAAHPDDKAMMKEFTGLAKPGGLQTWIAIGGFDFSDPGPTHTTWSDMVSTQANRDAFIESVELYMEGNGFQGVDLDWEYPGEPKRGGREMADTRNFVTLVKQMRAKWGDKYGISVTLAPDYWYLRWFDAKAMEASVNFFGFMAYDLHGSWDTDVLALGSKVRGQADIREIANNTTPLWFAGLNPTKINFGVALYGRGYTLSDPNCKGLLCPFSGPSKPGPCVGEAGVMSLSEIKQVIKDRKLEPFPLYNSMMKQITWDDQWIGYDDEDTIASKIRFASSMCFGGTMVWSIDFQEEDSPVFDPGDGSPGTIDGSIPNDGSSTGDGKALYDTPFAGFLGCDTEKQVPAIQKAWNDVVDLIQIPMTLNFERGISDWCQGLCEPGIIEQRIWGRELDSERRFEEYERIRKVFNNVGHLETEAHMKGNNHIRISCKDEHIPSVPEEDRPACDKIISDRTIGGYALASSKTYKDNTIVLCANFFVSNELYEINEHFADRSWDGKDPGKMKNRAAIFLHELAHLAAIAGKYPTDIIDQKVFWTPGQHQADRIYDITLVEKLAVREPDLTSKNADNYAWYATEKFFENIYGISKAVYTGRDDDPPAVTPTKALNIIRELQYTQDEGEITTAKWLWYSVPYGTSSVCMTNPGPVAEQSFSPEDLSDSKSPLGTFDVSIDGEQNCQYKRHAEGTPGALYCGEESHDCKFYARGEENEEICDNLSTSDVQFTHQAFVTCEWAGNANPAPTLPTKALDIILEDRADSPDYHEVIKWLFYSVKWTEEDGWLYFSSECSQFPIAETTLGSWDDVSKDNMPGGTYDVTIDGEGDCQYKNDGTGNPGALWCGGGATLHTCHVHPHADTTVGSTRCTNFGEDLVLHRQVVRCEWQ